MATGPEGVQGRPDLYWNAAHPESVESPDEAAEYAEAERNEVELEAFDADPEWRERRAG